MRIKILTFSKEKKFSSCHRSFVINNNVFFFLKLITPKLNGHFVGEKL